LTVDVIGGDAVCTAGLA